MATRALAAQLRERSVCAGGAAQSCRSPVAQRTSKKQPIEVRVKMETVSSLGIFSASTFPTDKSNRQRLLRIRH
jgi:hypothetical protein